MFDRELNGRVAKAELSVYDGILAEIMGEKDARLRKYLRKHEIRNDGHHVRKEKRKAYRKERYCGSNDFYCGFRTIAEIRRKEAQKADARDYKIEQENIAEYAQKFVDLRKLCSELIAENCDPLKQKIIKIEIEEMNMKQEAEDILTDLKQKAEEMRHLNDWLKYA